MMLKLLLCLTIVVGATSASYIYEEKNVRIMDILRGNEENAEISRSSGELYVNEPGEDGEPDVDWLQRMLSSSTLIVEDNKACDCNHTTHACACCAHLSDKGLHIDSDVCVKVGYNTDNWEVYAQLTWDKHVIIQVKLSGLNPPPICAPLPFIHKLLHVCVVFSNIDFEDHKLSGCVAIEAKLAILHKTWNLGCFNENDTLMSAWRPRSRMSGVYVSDIVKTEMKPLA